MLKITYVDNNGDKKTILFNQKETRNDKLLNQDGVLYERLVEKLKARYLVKIENIGD